MDSRFITDLLFKRDEAALVYIKELYGAGIKDIAYNLLKNREDAEEVLSDTLMTVWNNVPPDNPVNLPGYIFKAARNNAYETYRKNHRQKRSAVTVCIDELKDCAAGDDVESQIEEKRLSALIDSFLSGLDTDSRRIFICRYFYNMEYKEIAERYGTGLSRVKMSVKRTKDKLREYLKKEGY